MAHARDRLRRRPACEHDAHRIARDEVDDEERRDEQAEEDDDCQRDASNQVDQHRNPLLGAHPPYFAIQVSSRWSEPSPSSAVPQTFDR